MRRFLPTLLAGFILIFITDVSIAQKSTVKGSPAKITADTSPKARSRAAVKPSVKTQPSKPMKQVKSKSVQQSETSTRTKTSKSVDPRADIRNTSTAKETAQNQTPVAHDSSMGNDSREITSAGIKVGGLVFTKGTNETTDKLNKEKHDMWQHKIRRGRVANRQKRHCGCGGDITYVNMTDDTLDIFMAYLTPRQTPTLDDAVLPPIRTRRLLPDFYILPHDSATVRGSCKGGLQYETINHRNRNEKRGQHSIRYENYGFVRLSCMKKRVLFREEDSKRLTQKPD